MTASSRGERSSRWRFSISAISRAVASSKRSTMAGIVSLPAIFEDRQRRSPAMISYWSPEGRTRIGCSTPCSLMDAASSCSVSSCQVMRGCDGFGTTLSSGSSRTAVGVRAASRLMMPGCASDSCWKIRLPASRNDFLWDDGLLVSTDHLPRKIDKALGRVRARLVHVDGNAGRRCLADLHRLPDDRVEHLVVAELAQRVEHVAPEDRARVVKRRKKSEHSQLGVQPALYRLDDLEQRGDALECVVLRLDRDDHAVRRDERIEREEPERRRAVDENVRVALHDVLAQLVAQRHLATDRVEELHFGGRQLERRGRDIEIFRLRRSHDLGEL